MVGDQKNVSFNNDLIYRLISIVFAFVLLGYAIFAIIYYHEQSQTVL
jgi:hypothetical protein